MRRFEYLPDGKKVDPLLELHCNEGMRNLYQERRPELAQMLDTVQRFPSLFEGKTPEQTIQYFLDINDKFQAGYQSDIDAITAELEALDEKHRNGCQVTGVCTCDA